MRAVSGIRPVPLALTLGVYAILIALMVWGSRVPARNAPEQRPLALFSVASAVTIPAPSAKPRQPKPVPKRPPPPIALPPVAVKLSIESVTQTALSETNPLLMGGACDLSEPVEAALRANPQVQAALPRIPRQGRSVANAIMVWNTQWVAPDGRLDTVALTAIRDAVARAIENASQDCRLQPQSGPRLLTLPGDETVVLVLGSGQWRWQDMLDTRPHSDPAPVTLP